MRCLACNVELNEFEQRRKFKNHAEIQNPEDKFIGLCDGCFFSGDLDEIDIEYIPNQGN